MILTLITAKLCALVNCPSAVGQHSPSSLQDDLSTLCFRSIHLGNRQRMLLKYRQPCSMQKKKNRSPCFTKCNPDLRT
ncbi:uncharacterized protein BJX67DRAFT_366734 [Aspergillus lucknowensis]|uniref:Secreted protein n=1 Tax=Aspergillus lucknowensis TaxID=176173 RepID=A0ABR4LD23_9EURO